MTGLVVDASIALAWAFDDDNTDLADVVLDAVARGYGCVPALWGVEVANGLATGLRRERITADEAHDFVESLSLLDIRVVEVASDPLVLAALAVDMGLSAYDAAYLQLAQYVNLPLATLDARLAAAASNAGVTVVG